MPTGASTSGRERFVPLHLDLRLPQELLGGVAFDHDSRDGARLLDVEQIEPALPGFRASAAVRIISASAGG